MLKFGMRAQIIVHNSDPKDKVNSWFHQPRILMLVARNGLLTPNFADINEHNQVLVKSTIAISLAIAVLAFYMKVGVVYALDLAPSQCVITATTWKALGKIGMSRWIKFRPKVLLGCAYFVSLVLLLVQSQLLASWSLFWLSSKIINARGQMIIFTNFIHACLCNTNMGTPSILISENRAPGGDMIGSCQNYIHLIQLAWFDLELVLQYDLDLEDKVNFKGGGNVTCTAQAQWPRLGRLKKNGKANEEVMEKVVLSSL